MKYLLQAVLAEAKERGVLAAPYGRNPLQLPYDEYTNVPEDEDDFDDDEDDFDENPEFKFEYGFNPLRFVAQYLRDHNPNAKEAEVLQSLNDLDLNRDPGAADAAAAPASAEYVVPAPV